MLILTPGSLPFEREARSRATAGGAVERFELLKECRKSTGSVDMRSRSASFFGVQSSETNTVAKLRLAAEDILQEMPGRAAHVDEITRVAIERNMNLGLPADEFKKKISSALISETKRKSGSIFARVTHKKAGKTTHKRGWYKLKHLSVPSAIIGDAPLIQENRAAAKTECNTRPFR